MDSTGVVDVRALAADHGRIALGGAFKRDLFVAGATRTATDDNEASFAVSLTTDGAVRWVTSEDASSASIVDLALEAASTLAVGARKVGFFDEDHLTVRRYSESGSVVASYVGPPDTSDGAVVLRDESVLVLAEFSAPAQFGPTGSVQRPAAYPFADLVLIELDRELVHVRDQHFTREATRGQSVRNLELDGDGLVFGASVQGVVDYGLSAEGSEGYVAAHLVGVLGEGAAWHRPFGGFPSSASTADFVVLDDGGLLVGGSWRGSIDFDEGPVPTEVSTRREGFITRYTAGAASLMWLYHLRRETPVARVAVDTITDRIVVSGSFFREADFGGGTRVGSGGFILALTPEGNYICDQTFEAHISELAFDEHGALVVVFSITDGVELGGELRVPSGTRSAGIVRYRPR